ncbi:MAG: DUF5655 domain-containing protein [Acidimicrobiales bacterium]
MSDPKAQAATQIKNIEESTGRTVAQFTAAIKKAGLEKHGQIVAHLKSDYGLTHGNANLMAHLVRDQLDGGPASDDDLLEAQYSGGKAGLRPLYDELAAMADGLGSDVEKVIQKTGVSFRRKKQFALVQAPSAKRIQLGLNLDATPDDARVKEVSGMCSHRIDITGADQLDEHLAGWIQASYDRAG